MYIDIDPYDVYNDMTDSEKADMLRWLIEDGIVSEPNQHSLVYRIEDAIYRIKYRGLDQDKSAVEVLESILGS